MNCPGIDGLTREQMASAISNYVYYVVIDGDWQNDWLCHLPDKVALPLISIGHLLDSMLTALGYLA